MSEITNLEALMLPDCRGHGGRDAWYFPCGLNVDHDDAQREARRHRVDETLLGGSYMVTLAHRRHHVEGHDEMDTWALVDVLDEEGQVCQVWCECVQQDTHWHWGPPVILMPRWLEEA